MRAPPLRSRCGSPWWRRRKPGRRRYPAGRLSMFGTAPPFSKVPTEFRMAARGDTIPGLGQCGVHRALGQPLGHCHRRRIDCDAVTSASVRVDAKPQRLRADERHEIALPLPGARFRQRRDQLVIGLCAIRRTGRGFPSRRRRRSRCCRPPKTGPCRPCTRVPGPPRRHRRSRDWESAWSQATRYIELHFRSERKAVIGKAGLNGRAVAISNSDAGTCLKHACERYHATSRTIKTYSAARRRPERHAARW